MSCGSRHVRRAGWLVTRHPSVNSFASLWLFRCGMLRLILTVDLHCAQAATHLGRCPPHRPSPPVATRCSRNRQFTIPRSRLNLFHRSCAREMPQQSGSSKSLCIYMLMITTCYQQQHGTLLHVVQVVVVLFCRLRNHRNSVPLPNPHTTPTHRSIQCCEYSRAGGTHRRRRLRLRLLVSCLFCRRPLPSSRAIILLPDRQHRFQCLLELPNRCIKAHIARGNLGVGCHRYSQSHRVDEVRQRDGH